MPNAIKKLKQEEKKVVLAYAQLKLKANRLSKELDTMKQNIVDCFDRTNQNLIIVQDEHGNSFGVQKINRKRKNFDKLSRDDLINEIKRLEEVNRYHQETNGELRQKMSTVRKLRKENTELRDQLHTLSKPLSEVLILTEDMEVKPEGTD